MRKSGKKAKSFSWHTLTAVLVAAALGAVGDIWLHGIPLTGLPRAEEVETVTIARGEQQAGLTAPDDVQLMTNAANLLRYKLFGTAKNAATRDVPMLTVTYHLQNGDTRTVEAGTASVRWHGRAYVLQEPDVFWNIANTLYLNSYRAE